MIVTQHGADGMRRFAEQHPLFGALWTLTLAVILGGAPAMAYQEYRGYGSAPVEVSARTFAMPADGHTPWVRLRPEGLQCGSDHGPQRPAIVSAYRLDGDRKGVGVRTQVRQSGGL